jgi:hypothetical protein
MQIGQAQLLTRDPRQDIVLISGEIWSLGEARKRIWLQGAMPRQNIGLWLMEFVKCYG